MTTADERVDAWINRPAAAILARAVAPTRVQPSHLTIASVLAGVLAALCLARGSRPGLAGAAGLLFASMILDCADGQLARLRGGGSLSGRILDGVGDYVVALAIHGGLFWLLAHSGDPTAASALGLGPGPSRALSTALLVALTGVSMAAQAAIFDYHKHRYLEATGRHRTETPELYREAAEHERSCILRALFLSFAAYVRIQRALDQRFASSPATMAVRKHERPSDALRRARAWSAIGPSSHWALLLLAMLSAIVWPPALAVYVVSVAGVMNVYAIALLALDRRNASSSALRRSRTAGHS